MPVLFIVAGVEALHTGLLNYLMYSPVVEYDIAVKKHEETLCVGLRSSLNSKKYGPE